MTLPALIFSPDLLPDQAPLNGRRWASQLLLRLWLDGAGDEGLDLLAAHPQVLESLRPSLASRHKAVPLRCCSLTDPASLAANGALFIPDPSLGSWASWRQAAGAHAFSLIGQIHTLSTTAVMTMLDALVVEPVQPWDALICSSRAGRAVVERLLDDREQQLRQRSGASRFPRPQLPVIPLPLDEACFRLEHQQRQQARQCLGLPSDAAVVLWLGRRSMLTKADPWPMYQVLERVARRAEKPVWLVECGPDDTAVQAEHFQALQQHCHHLKLLRLGADGPVPEPQKQQALIACDLLLSLVDNIQETFGLSVAEAMAAGRPVVASNWDGYRDLVRDGIDGFLIPSRWDDQASRLSFPLSWTQKLDANAFPSVSGCYAQMVQLDLAAAEAAVLTLITQPQLAAAMGRAARARAQEQFAPEQVMARLRDLFADLAERRAAAVAEPAAQPPLRFDPVRCFAGYASQQAPFAPGGNVSTNLPALLLQGRQHFADQIQAALPSGQRLDWMALMQRKHG